MLQSTPPILDKASLRLLGQSLATEFQGAMNYPFTIRIAAALAALETVLDSSETLALRAIEICLESSEPATHYRELGKAS